MHYLIFFQFNWFCAPRSNNRTGTRSMQRVQVGFASRATMLPPLMARWLSRNALAHKPALVFGLFFTTIFSSFISLQIFLHSIFHNPAYQREWKGFVQRELDSGFGRSISGQFPVERFRAGWGSVHRYVIFPRGKMHQVTVPYKCRHLIPDRFPGFWGYFFDRLPDLLQSLSYIYWKRSDVFVDGFEFFA